MNIKEKLFQTAKEASLNSFSPYSNFPVGAAILADDGNIYKGCNVENISYPVGICAESAAIAAMICDGGKKIIEMVIFAPSDKLISPCGACRQRIKEFADNQTIIHLADKNGIQKSFTIEELLPFSF